MDGVVIKHVIELAVCWQMPSQRQWSLYIYMLRIYIAPACLLLHDAGMH